MDVWRSAVRWIGGALAYLQDHEPLRFGLAIQAVTTALTGWLIVLGGRLHLPGELLQIVTGLIGAGIVARVEEWKRSRVASAATAAKLLARTPPVTADPPIPLAEVARAAKVDAADSVG